MLTSEQIKKVRRMMEQCGEIAQDGGWTRDAGCPSRRPGDRVEIRQPEPQVLCDVDDRDPEDPANYETPALRVTLLEVARFK